MDERTSLPIEDHKPLSSVAMHWAENVFEDSPMAMVLKRFSESKVGEYYKCSLVEFLSFPHEICEHLIDEAFKRSNREAATVSGVMDQLNNSLPKK